MKKTTKKSSGSIQKEFDQAFFKKAISELLMQNIENAPDFFDCLETDEYNQEIIGAIRSDPDKSATISRLIEYLASMGEQAIYEINDIKNIEKQIHYVSNYCAKIFSLLSIEEIEESRIPSSSNLDSPVPTLIDAVKFITQQSSISRKSLMVISDKYRDKLMEKSQKNPPELDDDFFEYFGKYLKIEKTLTDKAFDLSYEKKLIQPPYSFSKSFAQLYLDHERKSFQARKFFEPLLTLKLYNRIPLKLSPPITENLTDPDNFISQQLQFSLTAETDEEKIAINTKILTFYEKLRNKLLDPNLEDKRAKCIELLDKTVENYLFLKQLSEDKALNKKLDNEKDFDKFFEYYETNLNKKYQAALFQNILSKLPAPTRLPPPSAQQAPAPAPLKKKETSIEDDIKKIFKIALSLQELNAKTKFINSCYAKFQESDRSSENYLSFLESALDDTKTEGQKSKLDEVSENLMPQILNSIPREAIENYFTTTNPDKPLSEFGLAILRESLKLGYLEINTGILNKALNSESAVMFLDMALEPKNLDLLINGSQVSRASQTVGYDKKKSFLSDRLALLSDKNKEKLLKTLLSDDEEYKNIKTNKELIFSTLGLDFIQGFYEQSTQLLQENQTMSRRSRRSITPSINRESNKLSDKEKQDLFKLLLKNQNFEEDQFKVFLYRVTQENPEIISEFFKPTSQFDIYQIKILKSLDPKTLAEKFILEDSIITQESKTSFLKSYLELGNLDNNKILIDLISRSPKSSILEPLFQDDNRDLIFNSCKGSTFYHKFIEAQDGELDEETQSKRVSMYLSSNKNNEQKIELLILLAQHKPDLFVKKLLEDSEDFKNSLSPKMFTETLKMESFDALKKMEIFTYLAQKRSDIIDSDEETKNAFALAFFSASQSIKKAPDKPVSERSPSSPTPDKDLTESPDQQQSDPEQSKEIPETTTAKLKQIFNAILPSTQSITLKPHYIQPQDGPLKDFKLGFFNSNSITDFQADSSQYRSLFHQQFDTLFQKILNTYSSKNEQQQSQLKTSLYAILAISAGNITDRNGEEIKKFLAYYDEILKGNYNQETRTGDGHGSWIGQDSIRFKKAMTILATMDSVFDKDNSAFSEGNLQTWLESQYHTPEVKIALNKDSDEYVRNILSITASNTKHEVSIRDTIKDFLSDNLEMLNTLCTDESGNGKKLLDYSYDEFSKSELSKLSSEFQIADFKEKFQDLKDNFPSKIANFKNTLNDVRLLNQYIETEDGQLLLKFICQLSNHNFGNILKRDVSDSEQITGINSFIKDLGSPRSFHQLKDDLIKIGQGISEKIPGISPKNPAQNAEQNIVHSL